MSQHYYLTELLLPGQLLLLAFHSFLNPRLNLIYFPQRKAIAPQANPPPNPTITILSPSLILPCFHDSDKAIGIEADELLPSCWRVFAIRSAGISKRFLAAAIILILA